MNIFLPRLSNFGLTLAARYFETTAHAHQGYASTVLMDVTPGFRRYNQECFGRKIYFRLYFHDQSAFLLLYIVIDRENLLTFKKTLTGLVAARAR